VVSFLLASHQYLLPHSCSSSLLTYKIHSETMKSSEIGQKRIHPLISIYLNNEIRTSDAVFEMSWDSTPGNHRDLPTCFTKIHFLQKSRDSVVGIATSYGLDDRGVGLQIVQTDSEVHPTSCPMGTGGSFPGDKTAGA
jgi:hypothetical protein